MENYKDVYSTKFGNSYTQTQSLQHKAPKMVPEWLYFDFRIREERCLSKSN